MIFRNIYGIMSRDMTTKGELPERKDTMRIETETAVRSIVGFDSEVTKEMVEKALDILRGKVPGDEMIVHNVRFGDARDMLVFWNCRSFEAGVHEISSFETGPRNQSPAETLENIGRNRTCQIWGVRVRHPDSSGGR